MSNASEEEKDGIFKQTDSAAQVTNSVEWGPISRREWGAKTRDK